MLEYSWVKVKIRGKGHNSLPLQFGFEDISRAMFLEYIFFDKCLLSKRPDK
jgi:hypothetical protein